MTTAALTLDSRVTAVEVMVKDDHKLLHGNGQPGLESRVNTLEAERKRHDAELQSIRDEQEKLDNKIDKLTLNIVSLQGEISELKKSVDRIYEKNKWWKELLKQLGWIVAMAFTVYEALYK